ncbi:hypothetical protein EVAR_65432_1 [Eumeta japonica]|uniref:Uncharacterized protein n=1 Tax=Eumeta variegata TaxID=151549 RepID=A0A4C1YL47_EUMVA|nr:hypothetical protein EVAR_65432_1 [Eumeta japonica]
MRSPSVAPSSPEGRKTATANKVRFGTLDVCGGMDDKIDDVYKLMKERRLYILYVNKPKRKGSGAAIEHGPFETFSLPLIKADENAGVMASSYPIDFLNG